MPKHVAFLRAINVGGNAKVAIADLRKTFADLGYEDATTGLQTGNIIFSSKAGGAKLEAALEKAFADGLGLKTDVIVRSARQWADAIAANPFPDEARSDPSHLVVMPMKAQVSKSAVEALSAAIKGREVVR